MRGIAVEPPTPQTLARLKAATGVDVAPARLIDLTLAGAQYKVMKGALDVLTTAPEFDLVVVVVGSSARFYPDLAVKPIVDSAGARQADRGVPRARGAGRAGAARRRGRAEFPHAGGLRRRGRRGAAAASRRGRSKCVRAQRPARGRMLDELEAYALLERVGVPHAPSVALDAGIKQAPALPFPYPVAVKALSGDDRAQDRCRRRRAERARRRGAARRHRATSARPPSVDRVLVQPMMPGLGEVLIGYRVDPDVGPLVMLAAGGILAEIHRDRSLRLAPVDLAEAKAMIGEVAALKALAGYRGRPRGRSRCAGAGAGGAVAACGSRRARRRGGRGQSADRAPTGEGVVAVDALVRLA